MKIFLYIVSIIAFSTANASGTFLVSSHNDQSGKIRIGIFERVADVAQQHFTNFKVQVPHDWVVIGGGVVGTNSPQGNLLTASYPNSALTEWLVSTKDHYFKNPAIIRGYGIGLKIIGLSSSQLRNYIRVKTATGAQAQHPSASVSMDSGFSMIGGGFRVNWSGGGNIATASYPVNSNIWEAKSKDHLITSPATVTTYAIGIRSYIPGVGNISTNISSYINGPAQHVSSTATAAGGFALSGCGAHVFWSGVGNLLWKIVPTGRSCQVASKDHGYYSPASIASYAIGIRY